MVKRKILVNQKKTNSPPAFSGATTLPPIGDSFLYIETSFNNHGNNVFDNFERVDFFQVSNITFYYNRFSVLTNVSLKSIGRFRIQLLLADDTSSPQYTKHENIHYSNSSADWKLLNLDFTSENYGINLVYDQRDSAHADMCFSKSTITHYVC